MSGKYQKAQGETVVMLFIVWLIRLVFVWLEMHAREWISLQQGKAAVVSDLNHCNHHEAGGGVSSAVAAPAAGRDVMRRPRMASAQELYSRMNDGTGSPARIRGLAAFYIASQPILLTIMAANFGRSHYLATKGEVFE